MAFVRERISQEDEKKYGVDYKWLIDRERGIFITYQSYNIEELLSKFEIRNYNDGKLLSRFEVKDRSHDYEKEVGVSIAKWYDVFNWMIIDESMKLKIEELKQIIIEALEEYGKTRGFKRRPEVKVKITPFQNK